MTREIDRSPARLSSALAVSAAALAAGTSALTTSTALALGVAGFVVVALGVVRGSRRAITLGATALLVGALVGGLFSGAPYFLLPGVIATVLAWDFGEQAINVGEQLGREADTTQLEVTHAAGSTVVGVGAGALGYGIYLVSSGGQPVPALVFLLLAAVVLTSALRN
ncbi:hypothetical protein M0R88_10700 [Halorussus gelatinilyticus]|uniref:Uncharacterized protein n=1 Tax=Halorussus gelatinilyticus TaxID=2937524 RepID=A0A8U0ID66_9EURY|nr:hypothetical protein [Halorussus gelatinilyticus]UPV98996.1 hypothetical protein M0R88_10700 [Halorussus gelatinilyticus]